MSKYARRLQGSQSQVHRFQLIQRLNKQTTTAKSGSKQCMPIPQLPILDKVAYTSTKVPSS